MAGHLTQRDRVWWLSFHGMNPTQIARRLDITQQRAYQILQSPMPGNPGRQPVRPEYLDKDYVPLSRFQPERLLEVEAILRERQWWTWRKALRELLDKGHYLPREHVIKMLLASGFRYDRDGCRWTRKSRS